MWVLVVNKKMFMYDVDYSDGNCDDDGDENVQNFKLRNAN